MFRGLATVTVTAADVAAASAWYAGVFGTEPYFSRPGPDERLAYVEFRVGDDEDEFGIMDRRFLPSGHGAADGGAFVYWHVDDLHAALAGLIERGAVQHQPVTSRGQGFATAAVRDPFGNVLAVMSNPHWLARHPSPAPA